MQRKLVREPTRDRLPWLIFRPYQPFLLPDKSLIQLNIIIIINLAIFSWIPNFVPEYSNTHYYYAQLTVFIYRYISIQYKYFINQRLSLLNTSLLNFSIICLTDFSWLCIIRQRTDIFRSVFYLTPARLLVQNI